MTRQLLYDFYERRHKNGYSRGYDDHLSQNGINGGGYGSSRYNHDYIFVVKLIAMGDRRGSIR